MPVQPSISKTPKPMVFEYDEATYQTDHYYPGMAYHIKHLGLFRKHNLYQITVYPLSFNPVQEKIKVFTNMTFKINFNSTKASETQFDIERYKTKTFNNIINNVIFNSKYNNIVNMEKSTGGTGYLIITHDNFYNYIQTFANHKENDGYEVTVTKKSEISDQTNEGIREYIQNAYNNWSPVIEYVLLVGDVNYIPKFIGSHCGTVSDYKYSLMDDTDWLPDILVGRFSVTSISQLNNIINKTIDYENYSWSSYELTKKASFMAGDDHYSITEGTHNYVISNYMEPNSYTCDKLYEHTYNSTTTDVTNAFNNGRLYGVYSGHGSRTSWLDGPPFTKNHVRNLSNINNYSFVFSFACLTGDFNYYECFGETWIREDSKASVGFWGSSTTSFWDEDDILERKLFSAIFEEDESTFGGMTIEAKLKFIEHYGINYENTKRYLEMYNILGDPSLNYSDFESYLYDLAYSNQSLNETATAHSGGRRIVQNTPTFSHLVFASGGSIFYHCSQDGYNWDDPIRISDGFTKNDFPCITLHNTNDLFVVWQKEIDDNEYEIHFAMSMDGGNSWQEEDHYVLDTIESNIDPLPVIQADVDGLSKMVVFHKNQGLKSFYTVSRYPYLINWQEKPFTGGGSGDFQPSLADEDAYAKTILTYATQDGEIFYRYYPTSYPYYNWSSPTNLSSIVPGSNSIHETPSVAVVFNGTEIHTAWHQIKNSGSSPYDHVIIHRKGYSYSYWPSVYHQTYYCYQQLPSIAAQSSSNVSLFFQRTDQKSMHKMQYNGSYWQPPTTISTNYAQYPSALSSIPGSPVVYYVWTEGNNIPYQIKTNRSSLNKSTSEEVTPFYSRSISWLKGSDNYMQLEVDNIILKNGNGSREILPFIDLPSDSILITTDNAYSYLTSQPFILKSQLDSIVINYALITENLDNVISGPFHELKISINIVDDKDQLIVNDIIVILVSDKDITNHNQYALSLSSLKDVHRNYTFKVNIQIIDVKPLENVYASLGHIYDFTNLKSEIESPLLEPIAEDESVYVLSLSNYPNPFNPVTIINFTLPQAAAVELTVYDIQGKVVRQLINSFTESGKHTVNWDGRNDIGINVASGVYVYQLKAGSTILHKKILLIR